MSLQPAPKSGWEQGCGWWAVRAAEGRAVHALLRPPLHFPNPSSPLSRHLSAHLAGFFPHHTGASPKLSMKDVCFALRWATGFWPAFWRYAEWTLSRPDSSHSPVPSLCPTLDRLSWALPNSVLRGSPTVTCPSPNPGGTQPLSQLASFPPKRPFLPWYCPRAPRTSRVPSPNATIEWSVQRTLTLPRTLLILVPVELAFFASSNKMTHDQWLVTTQSSHLTPCPWAVQLGPAGSPARSLTRPNGGARWPGLSSGGWENRIQGHSVVGGIQALGLWNGGPGFLAGRLSTGRCSQPLETGCVPEHTPSSVLTTALPFCPPRASAPDDVPSAVYLSLPHSRMRCFQGLTGSHQAHPDKPGSSPCSRAADERHEHICRVPLTPTTI